VWLPPGEGIEPSGWVWLDPSPIDQPARSDWPPEGEPHRDGTSGWFEPRDTYAHSDTQQSSGTAWPAAGETDQPSSGWPGPGDTGPPASADWTGATDAQHAPVLGWPAPEPVRTQAAAQLVAERGLAVEAAAYTAVREDGEAREDSEAAGQTDRSRQRSGRWPGTNAARVLWHLALLLGYMGLGVAATWPLALNLRGRLPALADAASYLWSLWWAGHQVAHLNNPWFTPNLAAPVGIHLGYNTLMPLLGVLTAPITAAWGPGVSYNLLCTLLPGLICYVMYRAARLWIPSAFGAIVAGALFGLSSMVTNQDWFHLNIAAGELFLPMALEAAVRLRRKPGGRQAVILGVVLGVAALVNQESAVMAGVLAALALLTWLAWKPALAKLRAAIFALGVALVIASPQLVAMAQQAVSGGAYAKPFRLALWYTRLGVGLPTLFAPSPRLHDYGLGSWASIYTYRPSEGVLTFGVTLTFLGLLGLVVSRRRRKAWLLFLLWLVSSILALGPTIIIGTHTYIPAPVSMGGIRMSAYMPYTWLTSIPGLSAFREADRFALLGLVPAALLAGSAVSWLVARAKPRPIPALLAPPRFSREHLGRPVLVWTVIAVLLTFGALEAGWPGAGEMGRSMPTSLPKIDHGIAADQSRSVVVDIPFGIMGGLPMHLGASLDPNSLVMAAEDGHPRSVSYTSWIPHPVIAAISSHPFYADLTKARFAQPITALDALVAREDAQHMNIGWAVVWHQSPTMAKYLWQVGFRLDYRVGTVWVYKATALWQEQAIPGGSR
jgi:hypothetical protein